MISTEIVYREAEIKNRIENTTSGEWFEFDGFVFTKDAPPSEWHFKQGKVIASCHNNDAVFIANTKSDMLWQQTLIEDLRKEIKELKSDLNILKNTSDDEELTQLIFFRLLKEREMIIADLREKLNYRDDSCSADEIVQRYTDINKRVVDAGPGKWYAEGWGIWDDDLCEYVDLLESYPANAEFIANAMDDIIWQAKRIKTLEEKIQLMNIDQQSTINQQMLNNDVCHKIPDIQLTTPFTPDLPVVRNLC